MLKKRSCCTLRSEGGRQKREDGRSSHIVEPVRLVLAFFVLQTSQFRVQALNKHFKDMKICLWLIHRYHVEGVAKSQIFALETARKAYDLT